MADTLKVFGIEYSNITGFKVYDDNNNIISFTRNNIEIPGVVDETPVKFIDYDGSIAYQYSAEDFLAMSSLPSNPSHTGLVAQGWNWTLRDAQEYVNAYGALVVGQMYTTDDGATRLYISANSGQSFQVNFSTTVSGSTRIEWGDGSYTNTSGTSAASYAHSYETKGDYVVSIITTSGKIAVDTNSTRHFIGTNTSANNPEMRAMVNKVEIGDNLETIGNSASQYSYNMKSVSMPITTKYISGNYCFDYCYQLTGFVCPTNTTYLGQYALRNAFNLKYLSFNKSIQRLDASSITANYSLTLVTIPPNVVISTTVFYDCHSLRHVVFATGISYGQSAFGNCENLTEAVVNSASLINTGLFNACRKLKSCSLDTEATTLPSTMFSGCYSLENFVVPQSITQIEGSAFSTCYALRNITIPSGVVSIGASAFNSCNGLQDVYLLPTTPPTIESSTFSLSSMPHCVFHVPAGSLTAYQTATNWSGLSSNIVGDL